MCFGGDVTPLFAELERLKEETPSWLDIDDVLSHHRGRHYLKKFLDENGGLMEYSVVYTDRAMNHMSAPFQEVMNCVEIKFRAP